MALLLVLPGCMYSSPGGMDLSFGTQGSATYDLTGKDDKVNAVALGTGGAVFLAGYTQGTSRDIAVAKLTAAGKLDTSFGGEGYVTVDFSGGNDEAFAVAVQPDGKVLAIGTGGSGDGALVAARWNTDGTLDASFGSGGRFSQLIGTGQGDFRALALDSANRALVAGSAITGGRRRFILLRLTSAGVLDGTFATNGVSTDTPGTDSDYGRSLLLKSDRILVGGRRLFLGKGDFAVMGFTNQGERDTSWGSGGVALFDFGFDEDVSAMTVDGYSNIVMTGSSTDGNSVKMGFVRMTAGGFADGSFGTNGGTLIDVQQADSKGTPVAYSSLGRAICSSRNAYLVVGTAENVVQEYLALATLDFFGRPNAFFGYRGASLILVGKSTEAAAATLQSDGKCLIGGSSYNGTNWDFAALRYGL